MAGIIKNDCYLFFGVLNNCVIIKVIAEEKEEKYLE